MSTMVKLARIKFHANSFRVPAVVACAQTGRRQDELTDGPNTEYVLPMEPD
jgi:hypothetical protein